MLKGTTDTVAGSRSKSRNSRPAGHGSSWYMTVPSSRAHLYRPAVDATGHASARAMASAREDQRVRTGCTVALRYCFRAAAPLRLSMDTRILVAGRVADIQPFHVMEVQTAARALEAAG